MDVPDEAVGAVIEVAGAALHSTSELPTTAKIHRGVVVITVAFVICLVVLVAFYLSR